MLADGDGQLANNLGALIAKRHAIVHGQSEGLGDRRALDLYEMSKDVADWMIRRPLREVAAIAFDHVPVFVVRGVEPDRAPAA